MTGSKLYVEPEYQRIHALVFTIKTDKYPEIKQHGTCILSVCPLMWLHRNQPSGWPEWLK